MTCYDTGTHEDHMSQAKAIELGYTISTNPGIEADFQLPNGKTMKAVGSVSVNVQFARQVGSEEAPRTCRFNLFERLAPPVFIGMAFLQATETITKYTSRMVDIPTAWKRSLHLGALGSTTNQVACEIGGWETFATADTGSDIALVSAEFATKHGLRRDYGCEELQLADGSLEYTRGFVDFHVGVYTLKPSIANKRVLHLPQKNMGDLKYKIVRFHILENLQFGAILDEATADILSIF